MVFGDLCRQIADHVRFAGEKPQILICNQIAHSRSDCPPEGGAFERAVRMRLYFLFLFFGPSGHIWFANAESWYPTGGAHAPTDHPLDQIFRGSVAWILDAYPSRWE